MFYYDEEDEFNLNKMRNIKNTERYEYNCAGYALNTFSWYEPVSYDEAPDFYKGAQEDYDHCIGVMLEDFPTSRRIENIKEALKNETIIAFRIGDGDFHYIVRKLNKQWYHKIGHLPEIRRMSEKTVFSPCWYGRYDKQIILFAKRD